MFELSHCEVDVIPAPGEIKSDGPIIVTALPKHCPICGSRVNRQKISAVVKN